MRAGIDDDDRVLVRIRATDAARAQFLGGAFAITFVLAALGDAWGMGTLRNHGFMLCQLASCVAVVVLVRWTGLGRAHAGSIFAASMCAVSAAGAAHLSQFGGLDGPYFYGSYTAPPVMIPILLSLRARIAWTATTVLAFTLVYWSLRPDLFDHPMAHIPIVYLVTISGISIALGQYVRRLEVGSFIDVVRLEAAATVLEAQLRVGEQQPVLLRQEIARQLHDDVAQLITGARIHLDGWSRRQAHDDAAKRLAELLDELAWRARRMLEELRAPSARGPLATELERLRGEYGALGLVVDVVIDDDGAAAIELDPARIEVIMASAREALTNSLRHGGASEATVDVRLQPALTTLNVLDNGVGRAADVREGYGLLGIRERVAGLGGEVAVSDYEEGLRLTVRLPTATTTTTTTGPA
ncbi:MAG: histidine kinase [Deltaproteobacteria bacterium]|nr:histidine kinase [Deltaproteobacteria bacterium]